jgi:uncharacterized membrane protein YqaE (UPF0057 family)
MRGEDIYSGISAIYEEDVKRRTYGNPDDFSIEYFDSLSASPFDILKTYIFEWNSEIIILFSGKLFPLFLIGALFIAAWRLYLSKGRSTSPIAIFISFSLPPLSWFILAKGHSGIHTHINFVLWYLGSVAAIAFIWVDTIKSLILCLYRFLEKMTWRAILIKWRSN